MWIEESAVGKRKRRFKSDLKFWIVSSQNVKFGSWHRLSRAMRLARSWRCSRPRQSDDLSFFLGVQSCYCRSTHRQHGSKPSRAGLMRCIMNSGVTGDVMMVDKKMKYGLAHRIVDLAMRDLKNEADGNLAMGESDVLKFLDLLPEETGIASIVTSLRGNRSDELKTTLCVLLDHHLNLSKEYEALALRIAEGGDGTQNSEPREPSAKKGVTELLLELPFPFKLVGVMLKHRWITVLDVLLIIPVSLVLGVVFHESLLGLVGVETSGSSQTGSPSLKEIVLDEDRKLQWQWAGENWIGDLEFSEVNGVVEATLAMDKVLKKRGEKEIRLKKMRTTSAGIVQFLDGRILIENLGLENWDYEDWTEESRTGPHYSTITIFLEPTVGFYGDVTYLHLSDNKKYYGHIALNSKSWIP